MRKDFIIDNSIETFDNHCRLNILQNNNNDPDKLIYKSIIFDKEDLEKVEKYSGKWYLAKTNDDNPRYFHPAVSCGTHMIYLRRYILGITSRKIHVGVLNGDCCDCRKSNLYIKNIPFIESEFLRLEELEKELKETKKLLETLKKDNN